LDVVTDPAGRAYDHAYDSNGNRSSVTQPNGVLTAYTYDALNRLTNLSATRPASGTTILTQALTLGPAGNRTRIVEHDGSVKDYGYDALYRLTSETVSGLFNYTKAFAYYPVGNRQTQTTTTSSGSPSLQPGTISYGYDTRDRLLSEQADATPATGYSWDANGNLTTKDAEATYVWDHENRLTRVTKTDGTVVEYLYDPDGNRVQTKTTAAPVGGTPQPAVAVDYLVDTSGSLSHVVAEIDTGAGSPGPSPATPTLVTLYVRGDDLLSLMRPLVSAPAVAADWQTRFYTSDSIGSIRRLTDEAGNITDGYTYSAFGELLGHSGTDPQPYAFTGEPLDPNSGWQYHRARWMDPRVGRFAGMDPLPLEHEQPRTLNRYQYVHGEPTAFVDPTGQFEGLAVALTVVAIIVTIASIGCLSGLRQPKTVGVHWEDGVLVGYTQTQKDLIR
jgi:RHS repeat-associated protein